MGYRSDQRDIVKPVVISRISCGTVCCMGHKNIILGWTLIVVLVFYLSIESYYKVALTFKSVDEDLVCMQYNVDLSRESVNESPVSDAVLFIMLYKVVLNVKSVDA